MKIKPFVSVILPVYNEQNYIEDCLNSIFSQDYGNENFEVIVVDGFSEDSPLSILNGIKNNYEGKMIVLQNIKKIAAAAMNIGIKHSFGEIIIRMDAHCDYENDYISQCVNSLVSCEVDNVGGVANTKGKNFVGEITAFIMSSPFGVGNSMFRIGLGNRLVDTVPFGAFKKSTLEILDGFNEEYVYNEDNEINYRIRKNGGKVFLSENIKFTYYSRDSVKNFFNMAFRNGKWNIISFFRCSKMMSVRHFIPLFFVIGIILELIFTFSGIKNVFYYSLSILLMSYCFLNLFFSLSIIKEHGLKYYIPVLGMFFGFHCFYGVGSLCGILNHIFVKGWQIK